MIYKFIKFGAFVAIVVLFSACSRFVTVTPSGLTNFDGKIYQDLYNYRLKQIDFGSGKLTNNSCDVIIDYLMLNVGGRYKSFVVIATSKECIDSRF